MARHNLGTVVSFEVTRTLTKRRFWIATLIVPVVMGVVFGLICLANTDHRQSGGLAESSRSSPSPTATPPATWTPPS